MHIICSDSDREHWLAERQRRLTASDVAAWLGKSPWSSKEDVLAEKMDGVQRVMGASSESSMRHGLESEAHNMHKASLMLGVPIVGYHFMVGNHQWPHIAATLDGLAFPAHRTPADPRFAKRGTKGMDTYGRVLETIQDLDGLNETILCEMKSTDSHLYKRRGEPRDWIDQPPEQYVIQVQVQMHVAGFTAALLCAQLGAGSMTAYLIERDVAFEAVLDGINQEFASLTGASRVGF